MSEKRHPGKLDVAQIQTVMPDPKSTGTARKPINEPELGAIARAAVSHGSTTINPALTMAVSDTAGDNQLELSGEEVAIINE